MEDKSEQPEPFFLRLFFDYQNIRDGSTLNFQNILNLKQL